MHQDQPKAVQAVKPSLVAHQALVPVDAPKILTVAAESGATPPRSFHRLALGAAVFTGVAAGAYMLAVRGGSEPVRAARTATSDVAVGHAESVVQQGPAVVQGRQAPTNESQAATIVTESPVSSPAQAVSVAPMASTVPPVANPPAAKPMPARRPVHVARHKVRSGGAAEGARARDRGATDTPATSGSSPEADVRLLTAIVTHIKETGSGDAAAKGVTPTQRVHDGASQGR